VLLLAAADRPEIPLGLDAFLPIPETNPLTARKAALGRKLFFDKRLSRDGTVSCATCHEPERAFTDARPLAIGVRGQKAARRSPRLINRVYGKSFFWDGRATTLEEQVVGPIQNPVEMDLTLPEATARVGLTETELANALASYVRTILSGDSPYDRYVAGDRSALRAIQQKGLQLFRGKAACTACHLGPNLTDERFHVTGIGNDEGRGKITGRPADRGAFKTPSLREVARGAPYMHDGSLLTLEDVVEHYNKGGGTNPSLDPEIRELHLTADEKKALVAFLDSLNGTVREGLK
jgi:cytochrome c peroxidase